ncbi:protein unc-93 homolog A-like isoform X2 [Mya arenaria]|nr:protein unc-93 homolog A-like isoform X2 [Mya arenaria]
MDNPGADIEPSKEALAFGTDEKPKAKISDSPPPYDETSNDDKRKQEYPMTRLQIIKNLLVVSFGFLFLFTSFQSLANLQSSLNREEGLGTWGLATIYIALVLSCMFLPPFIIDILGCKWTVAFSMLCYILYMVANFYAVWGTIIPAAIILGIGAAPLWSAKCTYLTETGTWYAKMTGASHDDIVNRFFGIFFMIFQTSQIWGNLISSLVFSERGQNASSGVSAEILELCGPNNCPSHSDAYINNTNLQKPTIEQVYTVCGIYVGFACIGFFIITLLLDRIVLDKEAARAPGQKRLSFDLVWETFRHLINNHYQKLLIPLTIYSGVEQAFIAGDFTRSYVSCSVGIWNVGYVMICYGVVDAFCSFTFGRLVQYVGHIPFFILAFVVHISCQITLLLWLPNPDQFYVFFILAAMWGIGDAVIQTQVNALYGWLFSDNPEAAFSNYRLWESVGFIIAFGYSFNLCTSVKLYFCIGNLVVGMVLYGVVEVLQRRSKSKSFDITPTK